MLNLLKQDEELGIFRGILNTSEFSRVQRNEQKWKNKKVKIKKYAGKVMLNVLRFIVESHFNNLPVEGETIPSDPKKTRYDHQTHPFSSDNVPAH
ncbi:hypothetical protein TNCV_4208761 [Trichonephila clavipes]|nr:hypothetical protein TNCV_4208761 [Trichonephila clavipes]